MNINVIFIYQSLSLGVENQTHIQISSWIIVVVAIVSWLMIIKHFGITDYSTDLDNDDLGGGNNSFLSSPELLTSFFIR